MDPNNRRITATPTGLLDTAGAAIFLGLGVRTLQNWRVLGGGPVFIRVGRSVRYSMEDLEEYLHRRRFRSTSEADQARCETRRSGHSFEAIQNG